MTFDPDNSLAIDKGMILFPCECLITFPVDRLLTEEYTRDPSLSILSLLISCLFAMTTSATIKLFLPHGDAKSLRTAESSNWTGKAIAAPRIELEELLQREELDKAGIYPESCVKGCSQVIGRCQGRGCA
jgi:hypothetical protein